MTTGRINQVSTNKSGHHPREGEPFCRSFASSLPNSPGSASHCSVARVLNHSESDKGAKAGASASEESERALSNSSLRHAGEPTRKGIREDAGFTLDNDTSSQECNRPPKELGGDYKSRRPSQLRQARDFRTSTCPNMRSNRQSNTLYSLFVIRSGSVQEYTSLWKRIH